MNEQLIYYCFLKVCFSEHYFYKISGKKNSKIKYIWKHHVNSLLLVTQFVSILGALNDTILILLNLVFTKVFDQSIYFPMRDISENLVQ